MVSDWEIVPKLVAGAAAGMAIGIDRTRKGKGTGVRTLGLVGLGAAAAAAIFAAPGHEDAASRVVQGLLTGIGFLGAGVIMRRDTDRFPHGLTTAASVWLTAALGAAAGTGLWMIVATGTVARLRPPGNRPPCRAAFRRNRRRRIDDPGERRDARHARLMSTGKPRSLRGGRDSAF